MYTDLDDLLVKKERVCSLSQADVAVKVNVSLIYLTIMIVPTCVRNSIKYSLILWLCIFDIQDVGGVDPPK